MDFPVYLKFENEKHFFKILSDSEFEEITVIGNKYDIFLFKAEIYPDKVRIQEMIKNENNYWVPIAEEEYLKIRSLKLD
ncbi:MAG: hypothetical protein K0U33_00705 [Bacteroidetes bacterium]|nr:hypothetical protein [Crocinitomicaceae bacterium]MCH9821859.1 hypothetical protein [Bacteroidota bacterium]|tara:strand:+ start:87704 stop:87940 length:237 start_codon:yes stop_codon:yes gene_type:complete